MPVTLQPSAVKYKDSQGTFQSIDCLTADPAQLIDDTAGDGDTNKTWSADKIVSEIPSVPVQDVQVNGTSVISNRIANIPIATPGNYGVIKTDIYGSMGIVPIQDAQGNYTGEIGVYGASNGQIKTGTEVARPITPAKQEKSVFYGLAKASGDITQSSSSNAVGTYTPEAKAAIQTMLGIEKGIELVETISGTTPIITGQPNTIYQCGEVSTLSITPPANGTIDVFFTSGSTATTLTVPNTVKFPSWFDSTSLDTDTIYEIMITNGIYGSVMAWES